MSSSPAGAEEKEKHKHKHKDPRDKHRSSSERRSSTRIRGVDSPSRIGKESLAPGTPPLIRSPSSDTPPVQQDPVAHLHPLLWAEADVALWLHYIGEGGLASCFDVINGVLLVNLDEEQLSGLGVVNAATRQKLLLAIKEVKDRSQQVNIKELKEKRKREQEILQEKESAALLTMPVQFSLPKAISAWTIADVGTFLEYIEIAELKEKFAVEAISGAELMKQTDSSLQAMGVDKLGHRKKILRCLRQVSDGLDPNMEPPSLRAVGVSQVSLRCHLGSEVQVLNCSGISTLAGVRHHLSQAFGKQIVKIKWKDAERDMISVATDEDLQEACHMSEERNVATLYLTSGP